MALNQHLQDKSCTLYIIKKGDFFEPKTTLSVVMFLNKCFIIMAQITMHLYIFHWNV